MSSPVIKVGDESPEKLATRLFARPTAVSSRIRVRETTGGFLVEYQRIPLWIVAVCLSVPFVVGGVMLWGQRELGFLIGMGSIVYVAMMFIFRWMDQALSKVGAMTQFDCATGTITIDSSVHFFLSQLEEILDVRGNVNSGGYRQAVAVVKGADGRYLYRLLHQCDEGQIRDHFVQKSIAKRLGVPCREIDGVDFSEG